MTDARTTIDGLRRKLASYPPASVEHATVQFNLGLAQAEAPHGPREANLRAAIGAYAEALRVFDAPRFPTERARVLNALGAAERELGMTVQARDRFREAVALGPPPAEAGAAANNLGLVHVDLGDTAAAVAAYDRALEAFEAGRYARQRAATLHNRGQARAAAGDLEGAAADYRAALALAGPADAPYVHAVAHHSLAVALLDTPGDRPALAAAAVRALQASMAVFTRLNYPFQHALAKHNLGVALEELAGDDPTGLRRALVAFEDALRLLDPRLHEPQWREARAGLDRVERRLTAADEPRSRTEHFARLLDAVSAPERRELLRYRLRSVLELPEPHRRAGLVELDRAIAQLRAVTVTWLHLLMERPADDLEAALAVRWSVVDGLDPDRRRAAIGALEAALGDLEIIQRVRVRDLLVALGYERPDGS